MVVYSYLMASPGAWRLPIPNLEQEQIRNWEFPVKDEAFDLKRCLIVELHHSNGNAIDQ